MHWVIVFLRLLVKVFFAFTAIILRLISTTVFGFGPITESWSSHGKIVVTHKKFASGYVKFDTTNTK